MTYTQQSVEELTSIERQARFVAKGVSNQNAVTTVRAEGAKMWDESGKEYIDFAGGIGVMNIGHSHPEVIQAIKDQADKLLHTCIHVTLNDPYLPLAEQLCRITPIQGETKVVLLNTGAEAVENAIPYRNSFGEGDLAQNAVNHVIQAFETSGLSKLSKDGSSSTCRHFDSCCESTLGKSGRSGSHHSLGGGQTRQNGTG